MTEWALNGSFLELDEDGKRVAVSAEDIYRAVLECAPRVPGLVPGKHGAACALEFSRYPAFLRAILSDDPAGGLPVLHFEIETQTGQRFEVPASIVSHEHVVVNDYWYPLERSSMAEIRKLIQECATPDGDRFRSATLRALLNIKAAASTDGAIVDRTSSTLLAAAAYASTDEAAPVQVNARLYPYQLDGWKWLRFIVREYLGGVLADEMGLGKTLQILAALKDCGDGMKIVGPVLVVAPGSLLENWNREITKFTPGLHALKHHGSCRTGRPADFQHYDVVITSYDTVVRDLSLMKMIEWTAVIIDEAQHIKNPNALRTRSIKQLPRSVGIAMTGTPLENRLTDLWSIFDFAVPGYLGTLREFERTYADNLTDAARLEPLISPLILRRMVADVATDLPERIDIPEVIELSEDESAEYERIRVQIAAEYGAAATIVSLTKLRQFCAHPSLLADLSPDFDDAHFSKYIRLRELLMEIVQNGEKALVFTSFTEMADRIAGCVKNELGAFSATLDGRLPVIARQPLIDKFSAIIGPAVLVLNPRVGGTGLNITAANHVIHYNLEWNPALEDQASARSFRRGQVLPVTVRRLFCAGTVEEVINDRVERKRQVSGAAIIGVIGEQSDYADVLAALGKSPISRS